MKKIALIHFLPVEYYPPATNMINYLSDELDLNTELFVFSTHNIKNRKVFDNKKVKIRRTVQAAENENRIIRLFKYSYFQISVIIWLIIIHPNKILYYESLSSFPVYIYKKLFNRLCKIYIHYHEYTTPEQYANHSMAIERYFHKLEQKSIYKKTVWISHTNKDRLNFFLNDNPGINKNILKEMPNYPPKSWMQKFNYDDMRKSNVPLKCVYIGSLSLKNTYIQEFIEWVIKQNGEIVFDIYAYNIPTDTVNYINSLQNKYINFYNHGVEYSNIPSILKEYNVGIIFYKPYSDNVINCVSNKFYEYYACGLDIWFSDIMNSTMQYVTLKERPLVIPVKYQVLDTFDWKIKMFRNNLPKSKSNFSCDQIYSSLINDLQN